MPGVLAALSALSALLTLLGEGAAAVIKIKGVLATAQAEGRDVTTAEVKAIQAETDRMEADVRTRLAALKP